MLLIERRRDGSGVIIRNCVITQQSREDLSRLRYTSPVQEAPPPKERKRRRDDDGQALLRYTVRQNPSTLHAMAQEMGLPVAVADEVLRELFQGVGETPPQPVLRRARLSRQEEKPAEQQQPQVPAVVDKPQPPLPPAVDLPRLAQAQQRTAALRSEAMRNADLRRRLAEVRLRDLSRHRCPWVRNGYAWFVSQQQGAAQSKTHCVTEMTVATL